MKSIDIPDFFRMMRLYHLFFDTFDCLDAVDRWSTGGDTPTIDVIDRSGGGVDITSTATDNNQAWLALNHEQFLMDRAALVQTGVKFSGANASEAAIFVGLVDAMAADLIVDGGASLRTGSSDLLGFVKYKDVDYWQCVSQRGAVSTRQTDNLQLSNNNNLLGETVSATGGVMQDLKIEVMDTEGSGEVVFSVDGEPAVVHRNIDVSSASEMQFVYAVKCGGANAQTLTANYIQGGIRRS